MIAGLLVLQFALGAPGETIEVEPLGVPVTAAPVEPPNSEPIGLDARKIVGEPAGPPLAGTELATATHRVGTVLRCPTCQGMSVYDSPADGARAMRDEVERMLAVGYSDEQVMDYFRAGYGDFILLNPRKEGANWLLWLAPGILAIAGFSTIVLKFRRKRPEKGVASPRPSEADAHRQRVEREIAE